MNQANTELETIIELTDKLASQPQTAPLTLTQSEAHGAAHSMVQDEAVFETLTAPKITNGASFMPPYADAPQMPTEASATTPHAQTYIQEPVSASKPEPNARGQEVAYSEDIIELDGNAVVHPQYTVTTELFLDPLEFETPSKQPETVKNIENLHIDTVHAESMHIAEMHINTIHAAKICDAQIQEKSIAPTVSKQETGAHQESERSPHVTAYPEAMKETDNKHDYMQQVLRDISTLQTSLAAMQLRLAAQDACIAGLESRLMTAETKNRELEDLCHQYKDLCMQAPQVDSAQLEHLVASAAARVVREEIQAILELTD